MRAALLLVLLAGVARGGEAASASAVTDHGRGLARILDLALSRKGSLLLVVDPTPSLRAASFDRELESALTRHRGARPGVAIVGQAGRPLAPGAEPADVVALVRDALAAPGKEIRNVYAALRRAAPVLAGRTGPREMLLVTLENGDAEDDLEGTVATLRRAGIRLSVVAREAFLSDSYWAIRSAPGKLARRVTMTGADGAFVDLPWGWLFQMTRVTEAAPSGHAMYGLSRLAAATKGRVFLFYPGGGSHRCSRSQTYLFCKDDHIPRYESLRPVPLRVVAPSAAPRRKVYRRAARDPYYKAVLRAWRAASKANLLWSRPSVKASGGTLVPEKRRSGLTTSWTGTSWRRFAGQAKRLAGKAEAIAATLAADIERAHATGGNGRYRAIAEFTYVMLRVTRLNLLYCAAFSTEVAPVLTARNRPAPAPPEVAVLAPGLRVTGLGYSNLSLCHGVKPFLEVHLPGGQALHKELVALDEDVSRFLRRNAHTPFAIALARAGLARFYPAGIGKRTEPPPRDIHGSKGDTTTTRPERSGGSSGGAQGPTSGGG